MRALTVFVALTAARTSFALQVFNGDPTDPSSSLAYPMLPSLPLLLPGSDQVFGTADDIVDTSLHGDVDLVVRVGTTPLLQIPPPAGTPGGSAILTVTAGGGTTGQGTEAPFTVALSDGATDTPYGNPITNTELDGRPVVVYAFADLDGDGYIGPPPGDAVVNDQIRLQEISAFAGRQAGTFSHGRLTASLGFEQAAPASIGGLGVVLVAAAYTGQNGALLYSDGTPILTSWPFFPPLDPTKVVDLETPHPPDPMFPSAINFHIDDHWVPAPDDPILGTPFALATDGSLPTIDRLTVTSGAAVSAQFFTTADPADFLSRSTTRLHVAPLAGGGGRSLVQTPKRVVLPDTSGVHELRVLPVDLFGNVADLASPLEVKVKALGEVRLISPDQNLDPLTETLSLGGAQGATILVGATDVDGGRIELSIGDATVASLAVVVGSQKDTDADSVPDDGDGSGISGDHPCDGATTGCDDNCPTVVNPSQIDADHNGVGDCCDGSCALHPQGPGCSECAPAKPPAVASARSVRFRARLADPPATESTTLHVSFTLPDGESAIPDALHMSIALTQAGHGGYLGDVSSMPRNLLSHRPRYEFSVAAGVPSPGGVRSAKVQQVSTTGFRATVRAAGVSLLDLSDGSATLQLSVAGEFPFDEDDIMTSTLACSVRGSSLRCSDTP